MRLSAVTLSWLRRLCHTYQATHTRLQPLPQKGQLTCRAPPPSPRSSPRASTPSTNFYHQPVPSYVTPPLSPGRPRCAWHPAALAPLKPPSTTPVTNLCPLLQHLPCTPPPQGLAAHGTRPRSRRSSPRASTATGAAFPAHTFCPAHNPCPCLGRAVLGIPPRSPRSSRRASIATRAAYRSSYGARRDVPPSAPSRLHRSCWRAL